MNPDDTTRDDRIEIPPTHANETSKPMVQHETLIDTAAQALEANGYTIEYADPATRRHPEVLISDGETTTALELEIPWSNKPGHVIDIANLAIETDTDYLIVTATPQAAQQIASLLQDPYRDRHPDGHILYARTDTVSTGTDEPLGIPARAAPADWVLTPDGTLRLVGTNGTVLATGPADEWPDGIEFSDALESVDTTPASSQQHSDAADQTAATKPPQPLPQPAIPRREWLYDHVTVGYWGEETVIDVETGNDITDELP